MADSLIFKVALHWFQTFHLISCNYTVSERLINEVGKCPCERLLNEGRRYPCLWDTSDGKYRDPVSRDTYWKKTGRSLDRPGECGKRT